MPLLRDSDARAVVAALLALEGLAAAGVSWFVLSWFVHPTTLVFMPVAVAVFAVAAWAIERGGPTGWISAGALVIVAALHLGIAAVALAWAADAWQSREAFATPAGETAVPLAVTAVAVAAMATLVACIALPLPRRAVGAVVAALALLAASSGAAAGVTSHRDACETFRFSAERWNAALRADARDSEDAERLARGLVRCRTLEGRTRGEVRRLLGAPQRRERTRWTWVVGWHNDFMGPGDELPFTVEFGPDGRAGTGELPSNRIYQ